MFRKTTLSALLSGVFIMSTPMASRAQQADGGFVFSETLQTSIDAFRSSLENFRAEIGSAVEGLGAEDRQEVLAVHAAEAKALQQAARSLNVQAAAEMAEAGFEPPKGSPVGLGIGQEGGRGGPGGRGGEGPGGEGPGGEGPGGEGPGGRT